MMQQYEQAQQEFRFSLSEFSTSMAMMSLTQLVSQIKELLFHRFP